MQKNRLFSTKALAVLAVICAMAFVLAAFVRFPITPPIPGLNLRYDPKDIVITIGGFMFGPLAAAVVSVVVALIQMVTVSATGIWGALMNIVTSCAFCCTAAFIYKKNRSIKGAVIGLIAAVIVATITALLWNMLVLPIFLDIPRELVWPMIIPTLLPFNLISNTLNAALTMVLYKYVKTALQKARLMPPVEQAQKTGKVSLGVTIISMFVVIYMVLWVLVWQGVI